MSGGLEQSPTLLLLQAGVGAHREYVANHPELTELLHDWLTNCLVNKPDDCYQFCREYFQGFQGGDGTGERDFKDGSKIINLVPPSGLVVPSTLS
ncbi:hypothetical protein T484DRAFT_1784768 [Baffinella frigidus]|nr:hypothetical protein T484DRAFT_1784768 [Cryptophyta sp. CCMP2293]